MRRDRPKIRPLGHDWKYDEVASVLRDQGLDVEVVGPGSEATFISPTDPPRRSPFRPVFVIPAIVSVLALIGFGGWWLATADSTVTRWHVPYQVVNGGKTLPLYDKSHCYTRAEIGPPKLRQVGLASGLPQFVPIGADPEVVYVKPKGYDCFMEYLSLANFG
jgi:hypothetical protein